MGDPSTAVREDPDLVLGALNPLRRRLLAHLDEPDSAVGLARALGLPRPTVTYHLRALEDLGLVTEVERRPRRGVTERIVARRHDVVLVDPVVLAPGTDAGDRRSLAAAIAAGIDVVRRAAAISRAAVARGQRAASLTVDGEVRIADPAALRALASDLADLLARHDRPDVDGAMRFTVTTVALPAPPTTPAGAIDGR